MEADVYNSQDKDNTTVEADSDHESCLTDEYQAFASSGVTIPCSICSSDVEATRLYWKGVEYCSHGVPTKVVPVCVGCIDDIEGNAGPDGMLITVMLINGEGNDEK